MVPELTGFWGAPTATVDWCETNYAVSRYVCEFFNTLSSLAMVSAGVVGAWLHRRALEPRFLAAFLSVAVVGIGSAAFHGTLHFELQMLDELPMLYTALVMVYILVENRPAPRFGAWLPVLLVVHGLVVTSLSALTRGKAQFYAFQLSFGSLEAFALWRVGGIRRRSKSPVVHRLFRLGMGSYLVAVLLWFVDLKYCSALNVVLPAHGIPNPQLHAVWHLLVSNGFYWLLLLVAYDRLTRLGRQPVLRHRFWIVGYLRSAVAESNDDLSPELIAIR